MLAVNIVHQTQKKLIDNLQIVAKSVVTRELNLTATDVQLTTLIILFVHILQQDKKGKPKMRRMTAREITYYAEKQREADQRKEKREMCHGMAILTASGVIPVLVMATENSILIASTGIASIIVALCVMLKR